MRQVYRDILGVRLLMEPGTRIRMVDTGSSYIDGNEGVITNVRNDDCHPYEVYIHDLPEDMRRQACMAECVEEAV